MYVTLFNNCVTGKWGKIKMRFVGIFGNPLFPYTIKHTISEKERQLSTGLGLMTPIYANHSTSFPAASSVFLWRPAFSCLGVNALARTKRRNKRAALV